MSFAIRIDGHGWRAVNGPGEIDPDTEVFSETPPAPSPMDERAVAIKLQLAELDARSIRAMSEALLELVAAGATLSSSTVARLQDFEAQKQALRAQLQ